MARTVDRKERATQIMSRLKQLYPDAHCALNFTNPYELLIAVILSAQTTDVGVNKVTPVLFERYPTPEALAKANADDVEAIIRPTGFFRNKTRHIMGSAHMLVHEYDSVVPDTIEELLHLPGVARKTANIVTSNAYGKVEGIAVDTHVRRLAHRFELSTETLPDKVEADLQALIPRDQWFLVNHQFIDHGRAICTAKRPSCSECALADICPTAHTVAGWK